MIKNIRFPLIRLAILGFSFLLSIPLQGEDLDSNEVKISPRPISRVTPNYPDSLKDKPIEGEVKLSITVSEKGNVTDAEIEYSPHPALSESAREAVLLWKFIPGKINGKPVEYKLKVPFNFKLSLSQKLTFVAGYDVYRVIKDEIYDENKTERKPHPKNTPILDYPEDLKGSDINGYLKVTFVVDKEGKVLYPKVINPPHPKLEMPALFAAVKMQYYPGEDKSGPVNTRSSRYIKFSENTP